MVIKTDEVKNFLDNLDVDLNELKEFLESDFVNVDTELVDGLIELVHNYRLDIEKESADEPF
jgi:hypothetical protein